jgi:hypothetical protein
LQLTRWDGSVRREATGADRSCSNCPGEVSVWDEDDNIGNGEMWIESRYTLKYNLQELLKKPLP